MQKLFKLKRYTVVTSNFYLYREKNSFMYMQFYFYPDVLYCVLICTHCTFHCMQMQKKKKLSLKFPCVWTVLWAINAILTNFLNKQHTLLMFNLQKVPNLQRCLHSHAKHVVHWWQEESKPALYQTTRSHMDSGHRGLPLS